MTPKRLHDVVVNRDNKKDKTAEVTAVMRSRTLCRMALEKKLANVLVNFHSDMNGFSCFRDRFLSPLKPFAPYTIMLVPEKATNHFNIRLRETISRNNFFFKMLSA